MGRRVVVGRVVVPGRTVELLRLPVPGRSTLPVFGLVVDCVAVFGLPIEPVLFPGRMVELLGRIVLPLFGYPEVPKCEPLLGRMTPLLDGRLPADGRVGKRPDCPLGRIPLTPPP